MSTRADYRSDLNDKLLGLEDEGYGDFEFQNSELDTFLELAIARLYPAVHKKVALEAQTPTGYGENDFGYVETDFADRIFLVEDTTELEAILGWGIRPGKIIAIDTVDFPTVNLYYTDAYTLPAADATDAGIAEIYRPLIVLGALIEALESRHDTGVRGEPPPTGTHHEVSLIDRLMRRYDQLKEDLAMSLPAVTV